jgi:transcriptional regulator with XRE-family HTH domain
MPSRKTAFNGAPGDSPGDEFLEPGQRLRKVREHLKLKYRDVEDASLAIARRHRNDEFIMQLSRLSDIENKGTVPSIFRLYSLCTIYRLDINEVISWYGVEVGQQGPDAAAISIENTHLIGFSGAMHGEIEVPLSLDPGFDPRKTTYLSSLIQKWGRLPLSLLATMDLEQHRYAFIGSEDWSMYPMIQPGSLVMIDESQRKIVNSGWNNEFERPIYFFEHQNGYACCWCTIMDNQLVLQPPPASLCNPEVYRYPGEIEVIGQVTGVAMRLDPSRRRPARA